MRASDRLVLASTVAVLLISFTARPLTIDSSYLGQSWFVVLVLAGTTVGLRRARLSAGFVFAAQLALLVVLLFVASSFAPSRGEPWYAHSSDSGSRVWNTCRPSRHRWPQTPGSRSSSCR